MDRRHLSAAQIAIMAGLLLLGCTGADRRGGGAAVGADASALVDIDSQAAAGAAVGRRVRVSGTARNAKLAGVVSRGDLMVYCLNVTGWPDQTDGQPVTVRGTLERTGEFAATTGAGGEVSQGTAGAVLVIRRCEIQP